MGLSYQSHECRERVQALEKKLDPGHLEKPVWEGKEMGDANEGESVPSNQEERRKLGDQVKLASGTARPRTPRFGM